MATQKYWNSKMVQHRKKGFGFIQIENGNDEFLFIIVKLTLQVMDELI